MVTPACLGQPPGDTQRFTRSAGRPRSAAPAAGRSLSACAISSSLRASIWSRSATRSTSASRACANMPSLGASSSLTWCSISSRQHLDLGVVVFVVRAAGHDVVDQHLGAVVLDIGFVEHVFLDLALQRRVEDLFLDHRCGS